MKKRFEVVGQSVDALLLGLGAAVLSSMPLVAAPSSPEKEPAQIAVQMVSAIPDEAAMLLVGMAMIGLAAAVRRAA